MPILKRSNMLVCMAISSLLKHTAGLFLLLSLSSMAVAQLTKGNNPPVVFLNGYQESCGGSSFAGTFGIADQVLAANGISITFFDNCSVSGKPPIEDLAAAFATFLAGLKYTDGTSVSMVDVVGHSMAGLIIRSYLSGKQSGGAVFNPPVAPIIRKAIFLASPNFGSGLGLIYPLDSQISELASGSQFLFDLGTWN